MVLLFAVGVVPAAHAQYAVTQEEARAMSRSRQNALLSEIEPAVEEGEDIGEAYWLWLRSARIAEMSQTIRGGAMRDRIRRMRATVDARVTQWFEEAQAGYFEEGGHEAAFAVFDEVARMDRMSVHRDAVTQANLEPDRRAWREAMERFEAAMAAEDLPIASVNMMVLSRTGRRTGYADRTDAAATALVTLAVEKVDAAGQLIENGSYVEAYRNLDTVSTMRAAREASARARRLLQEHAADPGMVEAKRVVDAEKAVAEVLERAGGLAEGDPRRRVLVAQLRRIAERYAGTPAALDAEDLADEWELGLGS